MAQIFADNTLSIGNTPLVKLNRIVGNAGATVLAKIEGRNPAYSVKCRIGAAMVADAEQRGILTAGKELVEPTSGNTGIALAMVAAMRGYKMILIMPDNLSVERRVSMTVYGAQLILTETAKGHGMEYARDLAFQMQAEGKGKVLNQFGNTDNPLAHIRTTGPEIWRDTHGQVTHFVSAMGTTGTITGTSSYLKSQNPNIQVIGVQPSEGSSIAGIRKWPIEYLPTIFKPELVDREIMVTQADAEEYARQLARQEGIFAGISSGGALWAALQLAREVRDATIVFIVCDRGDRYLSQGIF